MSFIKRRLEKKGIKNIQKEIDKAFGDKRFGLSMSVAGGMLWGGIAIFIFSLIIVINVPISMPYIIACGVLSGIISYFFVFRNEKYLEYFVRYEKWSNEEKRKYSWLTFTSIVGVFLLFYLGLKT
jgi:thiamine transporter ThiT